MAGEKQLPLSITFGGSESHCVHFIDPEAERRLLRKCDLRLVPVLFLLNLLLFVDRSNIGNARIEGLEKELKMEGGDFNIALLIFFPPYILLAVPSNVFLKRLAPSTWLSSIMFCWGMSHALRDPWDNF